MKLNEQQFNEIQQYVKQHYQNEVKIIDLQKMADDKMLIENLINQLIQYGKVIKQLLNQCQAFDEINQQKQKIQVELDHQKLEHNNHIIEMQKQLNSIRNTSDRSLLVDKKLDLPLYQNDFENQLDNQLMAISPISSNNKNVPFETSDEIIYNLKQQNKALIQEREKHIEYQKSLEKSLQELAEEYSQIKENSEYMGKSMEFIQDFKDEELIQLKLSKISLLIFKFKSLIQQSNLKNLQDFQLKSQEEVGTAQTLVYFEQDLQKILKQLKNMVQESNQLIFQQNDYKFHLKLEDYFNLEDYFISGYQDIIELMNSIQVNLIGAESVPYFKLIYEEFTNQLQNMPKGQSNNKQNQDKKNKILEIIQNSVKPLINVPKLDENCQLKNLKIMVTQGLARIKLDLSQVITQQNIQQLQNEVQNLIDQVSKEDSIQLQQEIDKQIQKWIDKSMTQKIEFDLKIQQLNNKNIQLMQEYEIVQNKVEQLAQQKLQLSELVDTQKSIIMEKNTLQIHKISELNQTLDEKNHRLEQIHEVCIKLTIYEINKKLIFFIQLFLY